MADRAQDTEAIRAARDLDRERVLLAFTLPHRGHNGLPGASDDSCIRCNAERALDRLVARLEADERALHRIEQAATRPPVAKRYAVAEFCDYVFKIARAALAAAAPGGEGGGRPDGVAVADTQHREHGPRPDRAAAAQAKRRAVASSTRLRSA